MPARTVTVGQGRFAEFAAGWPVLLAAAIGIGVGIIALPIPAIGVFMRDLQADFGWTRAQISFGPTILALTLAAISPFLGWIADRVRPRVVVAISLAALSAGLYLFSRLDGNLTTYYLGFAALAVAASGSTTIVYARALSATFVKNRGFALGLAMVGNGVTGVLLPLLLVPYAAAEGWRAGFVALALIVLLALPLVVLLIGTGRQAPTIAPDTGPAPPLRDAFTSRIFWIMIIAFALIPFAVSGLHLHFLAYLTDMGVDPAHAGLIASIGGVSLAIARVVTGVLIDRIFAPYVAAAMMGLSALAIAGMGLLGPEAAFLGAIAIGISLGAELDLIGYMTARYFGLARFGRIYGAMYGAVLAGSATSPIVYGHIADVTGSYQVGFYAGAAILAVSALLFLALPRFSHASTH